MIFAPDCDADSAAAAAKSILARLPRQGMPLAGVRFTVSIGIAVHNGVSADFAQMYRDADAALYQAREDKTRIGLFAPSLSEPFQPGRPPAVAM